MAGRKREEHPPHHPTPRRAALASAREAMQAIREMRLLEKIRHAWCMAPDTLQNSVKSYESTLKIDLRSTHTRENNPVLAETSVEKPSSLRAPQKRWTSWNHMMNPLQEIRREKGIIKNPGVTRMMQTHQRMDVIMGLNFWIWENLHRTWIMNANESSRKVGKSRGQKNRNNSIKRECNVLSNFLNHTKHAKHKISHYSLILKGCMKTRSGKTDFKNFRIILYRGSSSTVVMDKLTS